MTDFTFENIIGDAATVAVAGHVRPDGDCVGSCLGVYNYINENFPKVSVQVFLEQVPGSYSFLSGADTVRVPSEDEQVYDLFICLDCGDIKRLGPSGKLFEAAKRTFCVDHHIADHEFANGNYVRPSASSTAELLCELMDMDLVSANTAECLFTGIVDDTGVFQYDCTSSKTMRTAGELIDKGINFSRLIERTFYEKTFVQNRILAVALLGAKLHDEGRIISTCLTKKTMDEYGARAIDTEGIVEQLRITKGVDVAIFLHENADGSFKGSLRSCVDINLVNVAKLFDGGGHAKAAGFSAYGDPESEILPKILEAVRGELQKL